MNYIKPPSVSVCELFNGLRLHAAANSSSRHQTLHLLTARLCGRCSLAESGIQLVHRAQSPTYVFVFGMRSLIPPRMKGHVSKYRASAGWKLESKIKVMCGVCNNWQFSRVLCFSM